MPDHEHTVVAADREEEDAPSSACSEGRLSPAITAQIVKLAVKGAIKDALAETLPLDTLPLAAEALPLKEAVKEATKEALREIAALPAVPCS